MYILEVGAGCMKKYSVPFPHLSPDVEALISLLKTSEGGRTRGTMSGYRPAHLVNEHYLTTGEHQYYSDDNILNLGEEVLGTITFISPEHYPNCLWVGKIIPFQEGRRVIGYAKIMKIYNNILKRQEYKK
ncbi:hypothetical protein VQL36_18130 [Chengkuizengella sp. SCS-71B]|uniref:hypothetical protein n=1 Tax=Chengkuizengella sp. SCS-71B TaxID=3115290 RepID=UPI0032C20FFE